MKIWKAWKQKNISLEMLALIWYEAKEGFNLIIKEQMEKHYSEK